MDDIIKKPIPFNRLPKEARLDILASELVKGRGKCENDQCLSGKPFINLEWAHIISRGYKSIRWRLDNAFCLCRTCHRYFHDNKQAWWDFIERKIGFAKYEALQQEAFRRLPEKINYGEILYYLNKCKKDKRYWG